MRGFIVLVKKDIYFNYTIHTNYKIFKNTYWRNFLYMYISYFFFITKYEKRKKKSENNLLEKVELKKVKHTIIILLWNYLLVNILTSKNTSYRIIT